ncbi:MAG: nuclear transport factor 2 family protein [Spirochaetota bacterium]
MSTLFRFLEHEHRLVAAFFPWDATLTVTSYDPDRVPLAGTYSGHRSIRSYFRELFRAIDIHDLNVQYQLADDDHVSSHVRLVATVRSTGKTLDAELVYVFRFGRHGRIDECRVFYDTQVWTRAFTPGGPEHVSDLKNPTDDHQVVPTEHDVEGLVNTVYDNFYAGNIPAVLELLSPDAEVYFKGDPATYPYAGHYTGIEGMLQFVQNLAGTAQPYNIERFYVTDGDRTDVVLFEEWTVFATGKSYHVHTVNSWRVGDDGLLLGFSNYPDSLEIEQAYIP